jgi:hypothetical protein
MPELKWDETDFLDCLEVFPAIEEGGTFYTYEVMKNDLVLTVSVSPLDSCVFLSLRQCSDAKPNINYGFVVRDGIVQERKNGDDYLEFRACFFTRLWAWEVDATEEEFKTKPGRTIQVSIKPQIRIEFM